MEQGNLAVLVDAKTEYTKQLVNILKQTIYLRFKIIFSDAKEVCQSENIPNNVLQKFQLNLSEVPKWNQDLINQEYDTIIKQSGCDWIDELITAVFVSHTRILTSINLNKQKGKINLKIPKTTHFIHKCYIDIARAFWKNAYLFDDRGSNFEIQKNRREAEMIIDTTINETIRKELPVKHILKEYLGSDYTEETDVEELNKLDDKINLRKMVMHEIENCSQEKLDRLKLILDKESLNNKQDMNISSPVEKKNDTISEKISDSNTILSLEKKLVESIPESKSVVEEKLVESVPNPTPVVEEKLLESVPEPTSVVEEKSVESVPEPTQVVEEKNLTQKENEEILSELDLNIEELNLDNMNDLTQVEEVYLDEPKKNEEQTNIKKIVLEKQHKKKSNDYNFFD